MIKNKLSILLMVLFITNYYSTVYCQGRKPINLSTYHMSIGLGISTLPGLSGITGLNFDFNNNFGIGTEILIAKIKNKNIPNNLIDYSEFFDTFKGGIFINSAILKIRYHFQSLQKSIRSNISIGPTISQIKKPEFSLINSGPLRGNYDLRYPFKIYKLGINLDYKLNFTKLTYYGIEIGLNLHLLHRYSSIGFFFAHTIGKLRIK